MKYMYSVGVRGMARRKMDPRIPTSITLPHSLREWVFDYVDDSPDHTSLSGLVEYLLLELQQTEVEGMRPADRRPVIGPRSPANLD